MQRELVVRTGSRAELVDITGQVADVVRASGVEEGLCALLVPHTTAGLTLNENWDPSVRRDILAALERLVPWRGEYTHSEGNSAAHIKAFLCGFSAWVPIEGGLLSLGQWQGIYLAEFDGPRTRRVVVTVISSS
ncbi:MAG: YjbQ family protein [Chloroflexi bacterium]|nr:YjbQ family protein [Chloroflexota bacterium]